MTKIIVGMGLSALLMMVSIPQAHASEINILAGNNLTIGSTGQSVVVLQGLLSEFGYLAIPSGIAMGYFGSLTQNALGRYQAAYGISPAAGYFGPITKTAMYQNFSTHGYLSMLGWQ